MVVSSSVFTKYTRAASGGTYLSRVLDHDGLAALQADITSIAYSVIDVAAPGTVVDSGSITVADTIFDTLQTDDSRWDGSSTGFNFAWPYPVTVAPLSGKTYEITLTFTPASGAVYNDVWRLKTL